MIVSKKAASACYGCYKTSPLYVGAARQLEGFLGDDSFTEQLWVRVFKSCDSVVHQNKKKNTQNMTSCNFFCNVWELFSDPAR